MEFNFEQLQELWADENTLRERYKKVIKSSISAGHRITQEAVGKEIGCSDSLISRWLNGHCMLGSRNLVNMTVYINRKEKELGVESNETK